MTESYNWVSQKPKIKIRKNNSDISYYFISRNSQILKEADIDKYLGMNKRLSWRTFDSYKTRQESLRMVTFKRSNWEESDCTCPISKKKYICKHITGLAIINKLLVVPPEAKNVPIGTKRKRGRPDKAKKALIVQ